MNKEYRTNALFAALLATVTLSVFWPATGFEFINMDDDVYVSANAQVLGGLSWENVAWAFTGLKVGFWHPLTWLSYMLDVTVWGRGASGFHRTNLFLHAANTGLVFLLLRRLTGSLWRSALVAALFALHPLRVEPVAWVGMRKELLGAFFGLLALLFYARYVRSKGVGAGQWAKSKAMTINYWLAFFFFGCGLMSKPMVVTLPVVMLALDLWPLGRWTVPDVRFSIGWLVREKLPFFVAGGVVGVLTLLGNFHFVKSAGMAPPVIQHSLIMRVENAILSYVRYLAEMVWAGEARAVISVSAGVLALGGGGGFGAAGGYHDAGVACAPAVLAGGLGLVSGATAAGDRVDPGWSALAR